jgi:hypothetical protein
MNFFPAFDMARNRGSPAEIQADRRGGASHANLSINQSIVSAPASYPGSSTRFRHANCKGFHPALGCFSVDVITRFQEKLTLKVKGLRIANDRKTLGT